MELKPQGIFTSATNCSGCVRHKEDIMISLFNPRADKDIVFVDIFLSNRMAESLSTDLLSRIYQNNPRSHKNKRLLKRLHKLIQL